jgi:hypothetical protein
MSVITPASERPQMGREGVSATPDYYADDERGYGWVVFAGVLLMLLGTINFIMGLAAIGNAHFFTANAHYVAGDLNTWGWVVLCIGVLEWVVGLGVFLKNQFARWTGVVVLSGNAIVQLMMIGLPVLVAVDLRPGHPRDLRADRIRQADRSGLTHTDTPIWPRRSARRRVVSLTKIAGIGERRFAREHAERQ